MNRSVHNPSTMAPRRKTLGVRATVALIAAALGAGCAATPPPATEVALREPFDASVALAMLEPGPNAIACTAMMPQRDGTSVASTVRSATLIPATRYAAERMRTMFGSDEHGSTSSPAPRFKPDDPAYSRATRQATADADGLLVFTHVKDGEYYVIATVDWIAATPVPGKPLPAGAVYRVRGGNETVQRGVTPPTTAGYGSGTVADMNNGTRVLMKKVFVSGGVRRDVVLEP